MAGADFALDTEKNDSSLNYLRCLHEATLSGKSLAAVVREIATLAWGEGRLQTDEYFLYRLYDDERFSSDAKRTFVGSDRLRDVLGALQMPWPEIARDKPTLTALLRGHDLPIPETQAMRHRDRTFPAAKTLRSKGEVAMFLRKDARYPLFTKPTDSLRSLGVANIEKFNVDTDCLVMGDQREVSVGEFVDLVEQYSSGGYLFQTRLMPHSKIVEVLGDRVSTVRMFVLVDDDGPVLLRAAWKIPGGGTLADNFWREGNMLAGLDVDTGSIIRVLRRKQSGTEQIHEHPTTGVSFEGLRFPEWDRMRETVMRGAAAVPSCHFQGWDVALTDRGPVLVELEGDGGDPIMHQLCFDSGLLQGRFSEFIKKALQSAKNRKKEAKRWKRNRLRATLSQLSMAGRRDAEVENEPVVA